LEPYVIRSQHTVVELWSGYRIQFGGMERHDWQKALKRELKQALARLPLADGQPFCGFYDSTDGRVADAENSLFTNLLESMPAAVKAMRFDQGRGEVPAPPVPIDLIGGHLHYYRYSVGDRWCAWEPGEVVARWHRVPRRLPDDGSARPVWFALREALVAGVVQSPLGHLEPKGQFGLRLTVHATKMGPRNAISYSERLVDGTIAAFHNDRCFPELLELLTPKFPAVTEDELRRALDWPGVPLFDTPAILARPGFVQISPADERCRAGELTITPDSASRWPELSGEIFAVRPIQHRSSDIDRAAAKGEL